MAETNGGAKRVALVIANAAYKVGRPLANPVNDAAVMTAALERLGFDPVIRHDNLGLIEMGRAFADFAVRADEAIMAVIYFAGHGMEVNGENYLLPIDADLEHVRRLPHEAKKLSEAVEAVDSVKELGLIILDACRDNPYRGRMRGLENVRSLSGGLAAVELRGNTLVAYAAKHGTQAKDGPEGGNSPYARALKEHLETPDLDVRLMFGRVRDKVLDLTRNAQEPHIYGTLGGAEIYLKKSPPRLGQEKTSGAFDPRQMEHSYWEHIKDAKDSGPFEEFLRQFPDGVYAALAKRKLEALRAEAERREQQARERAGAKAKTEAARQRTEVAARQRREDEARACLARLETDEAAWRRAEAEGTLAAFETYLRTFPDGSYLKQAFLARQRRKDNRSISKLAVLAVAIFAALMIGYFYLDWRNRLAVESEAAATQTTEWKAKEVAAKEEAERAAAKPRVESAGGGSQAYNLVHGKPVRIPPITLRPSKPLTDLEEQGLKPKDEFQECENCPRMVVIPAGSFTMGSPEGEEGHFSDEAPQHEVRIAKAFAVGRSHVTRGQFAAFAKATGRNADGGCKGWDGFQFLLDARFTWRTPGFDQDDSHPVVCVNWSDANAYIDWLNGMASGKRYRLLSEAEAEYAARGVTAPSQQPRYFFGDDPKDLCRYANGLDETAEAKFHRAAPCEDGYVFTAPAASFMPNPFGLYDVHGNAWTWVEDCWVNNYKDAPADGPAWTTGDCSQHVLRGGSWNNDPRNLRAAERGMLSTQLRYGIAGFRVARTLN